MGTLYYGATAEPIAVADRLLAHLQLVTTTKFRRGECFSLSWRHGADQQGGRTSLWIHPAIAMRFVVDTAVTIDPELLHQISESASSTRGLVVDLTDPVDDLEAGYLLASA